MIRLTVRSQTPEEAVLQVDGRVTGENVAILEQEGTRLLGAAQRLVLDLRWVRFFDKDGLALLRRWPRERLVLRNASWFVRALLERHGLETEDGSQEPEVRGQRSEIRDQ